MKKAIVLGGGGWLGQRLVERLVAERWTVVAIDTQFAEPAGKGVTLVTADVRNRSAYAQHFAHADAVFNCCGLQHPNKTGDIYAINRDMPADVFRLCQKQDVREFVHVSSIAVYGQNMSSIEFIDESSPLRPITHYGVSKAQGDQQLLTLAESGPTPGCFLWNSPLPQPQRTFYQS